MNLPNIITTCRIILVPVIFWLLVTGQSTLALVSFLIAGISDAIDGFLASRFNWKTELGSYLDPLADKILIVSMFIALGVSGVLPSWLVIAVVSRDLLIVAGVILAWLLEKPFPIKPVKVSKANTVSQVFLAGIVLTDQAFSLELHKIVLFCTIITGALTFVSLAIYLGMWLRHMEIWERGDRD